MNKADCILAFAAHWLAVRSAVDQDDFLGYDWLAKQALDEADAAWEALNKAVVDRDMMAECEARGRAMIEARRAAQQGKEA